MYNISILYILLVMALIIVIYNNRLVSSLCFLVFIVIYFPFLKQSGINYDPDIIHPAALK